MSVVSPQIHLCKNHRIWYILASEVPRSHHNGSVKMEAQSQTQSPSECNQCGKKFQRKAHLLRHQQQRMYPQYSKAHHTVVNDAPNVCEI